MGSTVNVLNFLNGATYNEQTIHSDVYNVLKMYNGGQTDQYLPSIIEGYNALLEKRKQEIKSFYDALYSTYESDQLRALTVYYYYPFRSSRDATVERDLILGFMGVNLAQYTDVDKFVYITESLLLGSIDSIPEFFDNTIRGMASNHGNSAGPLDFNNMKNALYVSRAGRGEIPSSKDETFRLFSTRGNSQIDYKSFYGQHLAYDYLISQLGQNDYIFWVTKDVGEGYGYDMFVFNIVEHKYICYAIKATESEMEFEKDMLTALENVVRTRSLSSNYDYHVMKVLVSKKYEGAVRMDDCFYSQSGSWIRNNVINTNPDRARIYKS